MLNDVKVRAAMGRVIDPIARTLLRWHIGPDAVTVVGTIGVAGGALGFYPRGSFLIGTLVVTAFIFNDMIDGSMARMIGRSGPWGAFLDSTLDRIGDAAIFGGLVLWYARHDLVLCGAALYVLVAGALISYIRARAEGLGLRCDVGFAERSERVLIILIPTGFSGIFGVPELRSAALWFLVAATTLTIGQRVAVVRAQALDLSQGAVRSRARR